MAEAHLIGCLIGVILFCIALVPAAPLFIKLLLPFPRLEDATHWVGRIKTEGKFDIGRSGNPTHPRQFIVTPTGKLVGGAGNDLLGGPGGHDLVLGGAGDDLINMWAYGAQVLRNPQWTQPTALQPSWQDAGQQWAWSYYWSEQRPDYATAEWKINYVLDGNGLPYGLQAGTRFTLADPAFRLEVLGTTNTTDADVLQGDTIFGGAGNDDRLRLAA
jgi:hypothetical protein